MNKTSFFLIFLLFSKAVYATPFTVHVTIDGVNPLQQTIILESGEVKVVEVYVDAHSENVVVSDLTFSSNPAAMGVLLNEFIEDEVSFPKRLEDTTHINSYTLPGVLPAGEYDVVTKVHYRGDEEGVKEYTSKFNVPSTGIISMLLGFIVKILPESLAEVLAGLLI
jgi:hypothetical protein